MKGWLHRRRWYGRWRTWWEAWRRDPSMCRRPGCLSRAVWHVVTPFGRVNVCDAHARSLRATAFGGALASGVGADYRWVRDELRYGPQDPMP